MLFPAAALMHLDAHFGDARCIAWDSEKRPAITSDDVLGLISATPRSIALEDKADDLQVEVRTLGESLKITDIGRPVEPHSQVALLIPELLRHVVESNASIELRQFDRQCPAWSPVADDLIAISGADVFIKLFVSSGVRSVNGWHRDKSDVLVTVISGTKGFAIAGADATDDGPLSSVDVDVQIRPGDAVFLPRNRLHKATPLGEFSALLSIGLMRLADWPFRQTPPRHIGYDRYPQSAAVYRLCLQSHVPHPVIPNKESLRTRVPGGLALLRSESPEIHFAAAGTVYRSTEDIVRVLAVIHSADGPTLSTVAAESGVTEQECSAIVDELTREGLLA